MHNVFGTKPVSYRILSVHQLIGNWVRTKKTTGSTITEHYQDVAGGMPRVAAKPARYGTTTSTAAGAASSVKLAQTTWRGIIIMLLVRLPN